jgi:small conductance mechanosensitive channel
MEPPSMLLFEKLPVPDAIKPYMPLIVNILYSVAIFAAGWFISKLTFRLVKGTLAKTRTEESLSRFLASISQYLVLAATIIASLNRVGVQTTSLVAILASAGLAVGLALQGSLSNFASGVMILGFRPFVLNDFVEIGGKAGTVQDIGLFMTKLLTANNETVLVPNSSVTGGIIMNYTAEGLRRCAIEIGVAYGEDVRKVKEVLEKVAKSVEGCLDEPAASVVLDNFGASSLNFHVRAYAKVPEFWPMVAELKLRIYEVLNEEGIEIPFNQIVVHQAG